MPLLNIIKKLFTSSGKSQVPEDLMLRRHYLQKLEAESIKIALLTNYFVYNKCILHFNTFAKLREEKK